MKGKKMTAQLVLGAIALLGLSGLAVGIIYPVLWQRYKDRAIAVEAVITHVGTGNDYGPGSYPVYVDYRAGGELYEHKQLPTWLHHSDNAQEGDIVRLYVNPGKPSRFRVEDPVTPRMFKILGTLFLLVGAVPLTVMATRALSAKSLMGNGQMVMAQVREVVGGNSYVGDQRGMHVICEWHDGHELREFRSRAHYGDLAAACRNSGLTQVPVYIDPKNPGRYYVDISVFVETDQ